MSSLSCPPRGLPEEVGEVILEEASLRRRIRELAVLIEKDYRGRDLLVVGILKGAYLFTCDLVREIGLPLTLDFISINRYPGASSRRGVRILKDLQEEAEGRDLLLVEDIVDTGLTLHYLLRILATRRPASLAVCTLLERPDLRLAELPIRYCGFQVNHQFLIGYGLDYRDRFRELPYIATMKVEAGFPKKIPQVVS